MDSQTTTSSAASLGEELKRRREQRGITLRNISDETRINMRFLQAIESDNYRVLPGAVFNRRFVAAVAKQVGMDEEEAVRRYVEQEQAHSEDDSSSAYQLPPVGDMTIGQEQQRRSRIWIVPVVLIVLGGIAFGAWKASPGFRNQVLSLMGKGEAKPEEENRPPAPQQKAPEVPTTTTPAQPAPTQEANVVNSNGLKVDIKVVQAECWFRTKVDNQPASDFTLKTGEERSYQPKEKLELSIGESKNIEVKINGKPTQFETSKVNAVITPPGDIAFPKPKPKPKVTTPTQTTTPTPAPVKRP
jgi:cytoskeleton protein RodZ